MDFYRLRCFILSILVINRNLTESRTLLSRSPGRSRKQNADSIPMSDSALVDDYTDYPDVIFAIQKAGLSESDFNIIKEFVRKNADSVKSIAPSRNNTRIAATAFSALSQHMITFENCCYGGAFQFHQVVADKMNIIDENVKRFYDRGNHTDLSPQSVDVEYGLYSIREKQITDPLLSSYKPTVVYLLLNFQTKEMKFNILNAAMPEVEILQNMGIHIVTIIVDSFVNRQPHFDKDFATMDGTGPDDTSADNSLKSREMYEQYENRINEIHKKPNDYNIHLTELIEKYKNTNDPRYEGIAMFNDPRISERKMNRNLVLAYAKEMASIPEHGFKLDNFSQLLSQEVFSTLNEIVSNPMSWFGEGEVDTSCQQTRNLIHRLIWTPDYYTKKIYPNAKGCSWLITVPRGQFVSLRFETFQTERVFDRVTIYDGETKKDSPVLGVYSGDLTTGGRSITINGSAQSMYLTLETDGGNNDRGFLATWSPVKQYDKIENASVVILVDVSGSILMEDISDWVHEIASFFLLIDDAGNRPTENDFSVLNRIRSSNRKRKMLRYKRTTRAKKHIPSHIGLVSFAGEADVIKSIEIPTTPEDLRDSAASLRKTEEPTFLGRALDFTRTKQFIRVIGESSRAGLASFDKTEEIPKRVVFILSDWHSVDDPKPYIKLLCDWNIIPIFIGFGMVNLQVREDLVSGCGYAYQHRTSPTLVMEQLKDAWTVKTTTTTTMPPSITTTSLPVKTTTTTLSSTTTNPDPSATLKEYPYTGTYPTLPPTTPLFPQDDFGYLGIAVLLAVVGVLEVAGLIALASYKSSIVAPLIHSLSSESMVLNRKRKEMIKLSKLPMSERTRILKLSEMSKNAKEPIRRKTRYPQAANSFFTKRTVLSHHFVAPNKM